MKNLINKLFKQLKDLSWQWYLVLLAVLEIWSLLASIWPSLGTVAFVVIIGSVAIVAWRDLRLALLVLGVELLVGAFGYLFVVTLPSGQVLSLRMGLWAVIMAVWLIQAFGRRRDLMALGRELLQEPLTRILAVFLVALLVSVVVGLGRYPLNQVYQDANNWLFLLLILPMLDRFRLRSDIDLAWPAIKLGIVWLTVKTLVLGYIFSHNFGDFGPLLYNWLRHSEMAEITFTTNGFWRIFSQSHIYLLPGLLWLISRVRRFANDSATAENILAFSSLIAAMVFSLSRSIWLGLALGLALLALANWRHWRVLFGWLAYGFFSIAVALIIVWTAINFPVPETGSLRNLDALSGRMSLDGDAAISSRWQLWQPLWHKIASEPWLGQGFGTTVRYQSLDPRILAQDPEGWYETFAFEWGWFDLWLKLGLWGVLAYLSWLSYLVVKLLRSSEWSWLGATIIASLVVHYFTPYLNHPLGLMLLIGAWVIVRLEDRERALAK